MGLDLRVSDQNLGELPENSSIQDFVAKLMLMGRVGLMSRSHPGYLQGIFVDVTSFSQNTS